MFDASFSVVVGKFICISVFSKSVSTLQNEVEFPLVHLSGCSLSAVTLILGPSSSGVFSLLVLDLF